MPYRVRKQHCAKGEGGSGSYVVQVKSGGKWSKKSCHADKQSAHISIGHSSQGEVDQSEDGEVLVETDPTIYEYTYQLIRQYVRDVLLHEYVTAADNDPGTMKANQKQRQSLLDLLAKYDTEEFQEVGEFLDTVAGADRLAQTAPEHDRYFTGEDVDGIVTALRADGIDDVADRLEKVNFAEYFI